jgi:hypothetical protein
MNGYGGAARVWKAPPFIYYLYIKQEPFIYNVFTLGKPYWFVYCTIIGDPFIY